jgi:hypothetical protein
LFSPSLRSPKKGYQRSKKPLLIRPFFTLTSISLFFYPKKCVRERRGERGADVGRGPLWSPVPSHHVSRMLAIFTVLPLLVYEDRSAVATRSRTEARVERARISSNRCSASSRISSRMVCTCAFTPLLLPVRSVGSTILTA